ncbi:MAG: stage sporulation protein [Bacilli bacterium]|nr:stage sporulation protein [Bacilli bacterium]
MIGSDSIDIVFQVAGIGVLVAAISAIFKSVDKDEFANWTTLAGVIIILFIIVNKVGELFAEIRQVFLIH